MLKHIIPVGIAVLAGMLFAFALQNLFGPKPPQFESIQVDRAAIEKGEPDAKVSTMEKITTPAVKPVLHATAAGAARNDVVSFCTAAGIALSGARPPAPAEVPGAVVRPTVAPPVQSADSPRTPAPEPPSASLPAIAFPRSGTATRRSMEFWSVSSSGDLDRTFYRVRYPVTWKADGDSLLVQSSRFGVVRELAPIAPCAAGGALSGKTNSVLPAAIGCVLSAILIAR